MSTFFDFEKLLINRLLLTIEQEQLIRKHQCSFRQELATEEQIHQVAMKINKF